MAGLLKVHIDIDAAVAVIRGSDTVDEARAGLCKKFTIDDVQADYVLALQLRRLTRLDVIELRNEAKKLDTEFDQLTELISSDKARRKVIDAELKATAKLFDAPVFDRRTVLDLDATPVGGTAGEDGPRERKPNPNWRLDDRGMLSESHGELLTAGLGWAAWADGRIKFFTGAGLPTKIRDVPVAPDIAGLIGSGVLPDGAHLALVTRAGKVLRIDPSAVNPQGAAGNGVAGIRLAEDDAVIAALPITGSGDEALLSVSEKGWKITACSDIPVKGRGGGGVGFHPYVGGESMLLSVTVSPTGFVRNGRRVRAEARAKATVKSAPSGIVPAEQ